MSDFEHWPEIEGETIKSALLEDEETLLLEFVTGRKVKILVGSSTPPHVELTPFLYCEEVK